MENKYFTPDLEDIRFGYECEVFGQTTTKLIKNVDFHKVIVDLHMEVGQKIGINQIPNLIKKRFIRTPYLTKEQIEAEGWEFIKHHAGTEGYDFEKDEYSLYVDFDFRGEIYLKIYNGEHYEEFNYFSGKCKDINTFRKICKLLEI